MKARGRRTSIIVALMVIVGTLVPAVGMQAATCIPTGFYRDGINMTAALVNPSGTVTGEVDATKCNIGVYYDQNGAINDANIFGANYFGVLVNGDTQNLTVDIKNSAIHDIGERPLNGAQHGVAIYYRAFFAGTTEGKISGNHIWNYQKGGIVVNGAGSTATIQSNTVAGQGPVNYTAQNGIQVGYGAVAQIMRNTISGHSYTGRWGTSSGGIIVVGGAGYGTCPNGFACPYTNGTVIEGNQVYGNDIGIWLSNIDANYYPPVTETNTKVVNNVISNAGLNNVSGYGYPNGYQAGIVDQGNNDKLINNKISGLGYDPNQSTNSFVYTYAIDASSPWTSKAKVHANKID